MLYCLHRCFSLRSFILYVYEQLEFSPPFITEGKMTKLIEPEAYKADFYFLNEIFNASLLCNYALVTFGPLLFERLCSNFLVLFSLAHHRFCDAFYKICLTKNHRHREGELRLIVVNLIVQHDDQ